MLIDYNNSLVNLTSSILMYFDAEYNHNTLKEVDEILKEKYKNVVVLLLDGLGVDALRHHLPEDSFFRRNMIKEYSAVFPPTTTAAITTMECGLTPFEHGWLGWSLYSRAEVIEKKLFGTGKMHPKLEEFIGDYLGKKSIKKLN